MKQLNIIQVTDVLNWLSQQEDRESVPIEKLAQRYVKENRPDPTTVAEIVEIAKEALPDPEKANSSIHVIPVAKPIAVMDFRNPVILGSSGIWAVYFKRRYCNHTRTYYWQYLETR